MGVPLLIGLLALGSPDHGKTTQQSEQPQAMEQCDAFQAGIELPPATVEVATQSRG